MLMLFSFAMLTGYPPFQSKTQEEIYEKVRSLTYFWPKDSEHGNHIPQEARDLVGSCLNLNEEERPEPDDLVEHPFFNMYDGCIPRRLDPLCRTAKPPWLLASEPRGDCMDVGSGLDSDDTLESSSIHSDDPSERYRQCKDAFYDFCGVGRRADGSIRKPAGRHWKKSAYAECLREDEQGLQPVIPLPEDSVYKYPSIREGDWSIPKCAATADRKESAVAKNSPSSRNLSIRIHAATATRSQAALAAANQRKKESKSHAASLRHRAGPGGSSARKTRNDAPPTDVPDSGPSITLPRDLSEKAIRPSAPAQCEPDDDLPRSPPKLPSKGSTRSQSRHVAVKSEPQEVRTHSSSRTEIKDVKEQDTRNTDGTRQKPQPQEEEHPTTRQAPAGKTSSTIGLSPLFHADDVCDVMRETSCSEVNAKLRLMLANLINHPAPRRRTRPTRTAHAYVTKWVDYTHRYGIGYALDDGSVGCLFRGENGQPASGVVIRDGERHFRRKLRGPEDAAEEDCAGAEQLVPQNGGQVEFYENSGCPDSSDSSFAVRRVMVPSSVFQVKSSASSGKIRTTPEIEYAKRDAEKAKRVKLVDQFGRYMIRSLRHGEEGASSSGNGGGYQYIKFYQRLGNVGVWGFGDGAFQVCAHEVHSIFCLRLNCLVEVQLPRSYQNRHIASRWIDIIVDRLLPSIGIRSSISLEERTNAPNRIRHPRSGLRRGCESNCRCRWQLFEHGDRKGARYTGSKFFPRKDCFYPKRAANMDQAWWIGRTSL